eukprot:515198-Amphidinium_carterae.2
MVLATTRAPVYTGTIQRPDSYYERRLLQEMIQASYIKFHPTTRYHRATREIRRFYDGFQIYNFNDK